MIRHLVALVITLGVNVGLVWALAALRTPVFSPPPAKAPPPRVIAAPQPPPPPPETIPQPTAEITDVAEAPAALPALDLPSTLAAPTLGEPDPFQLGPTGGPGLATALAGDTLAMPDPARLVLDEALVDTPPRPLVNPSPRYPPGAREAGVEGLVQLRVLVDREGAVEQVDVLRAEPKGPFEAAARAAVRRWRFSPATYEGQPVRAWVRQKLVFELR